MSLTMAERPLFFIEAHGEPVRGRLHIALRAESYSASRRLRCGADARGARESLWQPTIVWASGPATGISIWFRDHADHHMPILLDSDGPFKRCSVEKGHSERQLKPLALVDPPAGLFAQRALAASAPSV
jgi:hypothetical protein